MNFEEDREISIFFEVEDSKKRIVKGRWEGGDYDLLSEEGLDEEEVRNLFR